jgi:hypothetical protein
MNHHALCFIFIPNGLKEAGVKCINLFFAKIQQDVVDLLNVLPQAGNVNAPAGVWQGGTAIG